MMTEGMKRVLFLDFDGVLNTEKYQEKLRLEGEPRWDDFGQLFDPKAVENLKMILDAVPDVLLVISSSWKLEGLDRMKALWEARGLPGTVHGVTPDYVPDLLDINQADPDNMAMLAGKGNEVKEWLSRFAPDGCKYVILDDVPDFLPEQEAFLICTDPRAGITHNVAVRVISLLKSL